MGVVYSGVESATGRPVAIKVLRHRALRFAHTFERERDALSALSHPNVVRYIGHGTTPDGMPYLVTEWLEGEDLEARLTRGKLPVATAVDHAVSVGRALGAAHARGIVHRDVKPANIHLGAGGEIKLLDFGVAHLLGEHAGPVAVGTALYMAPEQVRSAEIVDARSDVYALGCVLFECLTGRAPFAGDSATVVLAKAIFEPAPRVASLGVAVSQDLESLLARMLSKRADDRPASGQEAADLLAACRLEPAGAPELSLATRDTDEQRIGCVALISNALVARVTTLADEYAVAVDGLLDGTLLVTARDLEPADQARRIARFAAALVASHPDSAAAVCTGSLGGATSNAIPRAEELLRRTAPGQVRTCPATARILEGGPDQIVGRDDVLAALRDISQPRGAARAALVIGEAGMGKTCILHEIARHLTRAGSRTILLRGEAHRTGSPLFPVAAWLRQRGPAAEHHAAALSLIAGGERAEPWSALEGRDSVERAVASFLAAETRATGATILVDDAQWLDAATVRLLSLMLPHARSGDIGLLLFGRPDATALFPFFEGDLLVRLGPLSPGASRALALATSPELDESRLQLLLERAEGHPVVIRELSRAAGGGLTGAPDTVLGIVQARLRGLPDEARRAARAAAVLGLRFSRAGLTRLVGKGAEEGLEALLAARVVDLEEGNELSFASPLVREAAYELLTDDNRALAHAEAARWFDDQPDRDSALVAWHDERGGQPSLAARSYAEAARRALTLGDLSLAIAHARRGIGCGADGEVLGALRLWEAEALLWSGELAEAGVRAGEALALLTSGSLAWMTAARVQSRACARRADVGGLLEVYAMVGTAAPTDRAARGMKLQVFAAVAWWLLELSRTPEATRACRDVADLAAQLDLTLAEEAIVHRLKANRAEHDGEWSLMIESHVAAASLSSQLGAHNDAIVARLNVAGAHAEIGLPEAGIALLDALIDEAGVMGLGYAVCYACYLRGRALRRSRRNDEAEVDLSRALASGVDDVRVRAQAHTELALVALERNDLDEARERAELAIELSSALPKTHPHALAVRAAIHLLEGEPDTALVMAERAVKLTRRDFPTGDDPSFVWRAYLDVALAMGSPAAADISREAAAQLIARSERVADPEQRRTFLAQPDNVHILGQAEALGRTH